MHCMGVVARLLLSTISPQTVPRSSTWTYSLYPYVCKSKHYPIGHPRCLIGPNLRGLDVNSYEGLIKCKVLPPRGLRIPLLPCHINGKFMFVLCRTCAETANCGVCGHTRSERCITGTWVSVELQKAVTIGYVIV